MYNFANEENKVADSFSKKCEAKYSKVCDNSCSFVLRIFIVICGIVCIILVSLGYEHDLDEGTFGSSTNTSKIDSNDTTTQAIYSGYGIGYKAEILTQLFLAVIIICSSLSLLYLGFFICTQKASSDWRLLNKCFHIILGLFLLAGTVCGGFGVEYFRENCCRIVPTFSRRGISYEYNNSSLSGYDSWCLCKMKTNDSVTFTSYQWNENYIGHEIKTASPHHQTIHAFSLLMAFVNCIMYITAFFFP